MLRILHAIHDFLPRHRAGSEIYTWELCRQLAARHHVTVLCAEYDPARKQGHVTWRVQDGLPVVEIVNNWVCRTFADTYRPPEVGDQIGHVLRAVQPDVIHVHNLLNLSFDLPARARALGIPVVATLHDYTLVCASGGQRLHRAEQHRCDTIDPDRCVRCFRDSPFYTQMSFGAMTARTGRGPALHRIGAALNRRAPSIARVLGRAVRGAEPIAITTKDIEERLAAARGVMEQIDLFVAPSASIAAEFGRLGVEPSRVRISDYGFAPQPRAARASQASGRARTLRVGFVGTLVWHKGVHVLIDAIARLPSGACELTIFGDPGVFPDYSARLRAQAAALPVRFAGPFDRDRTAQIYAQMDVLAGLSLWLENSPLVIHEAFMAGVPVVGSRIGGIPDLVAHERNGLLYDPPHSADALGQALRRLADAPALVEAMAARVPEVKSLREDAEGWEDLYAEVVGRGRLAGSVA